jgi:hypothetical protein
MFADQQGEPFAIAVDPPPVSVVVDAARDA